ncbi:MAG TPA: cytochrome c peroxidase [Acidobacteriaceae bacterium]
MTVCILLAAGCRQPSKRPAGATVTIAAPLGLPAVPYPKDNPPTAETIALGRRLFYDNILSKGNSLSCSSCHQPEFGFRDARELSIGAEGKLGKRHAPTIINAAYYTRLFWDGRAKSLEDQVGFPIADPLEMNQTHEASVAKIKKNPEYEALFAQAFGSPGVTMGRLSAALASFERTIVSGDSPFDKYQYEGKKDALTPAQIRGLAVFLDPHKGNCASCHTIGPKDALFTDNQFHNTGEGVGDDGQFTDQGYYEQTRKNADRGTFKTPTLRDVAISGPYMHDGRLKTLKDVVDFYAGRGNSNPYLDPRMANIQLTGQDRSDLVEFMRALTGTLPKNLGRPQTGNAGTEGRGNRDQKTLAVTPPDSEKLPTVAGGDVGR